MNKNYKLTSTLLLILSVFTIFFVWKTNAQLVKPKLKIVQTNGVSEELKPVEFQANLSTPDFYQSNHLFQYKDDKLAYLDDQNIIQRLDGHSDPLVDDLIHNYRSFMRGKNPNADRYILTDNSIIYTAMTSETYWNKDTKDQLNISIFDKESEIEKEYIISLTDKDHYYTLHTAHYHEHEIFLLMTEYTESGRVEYFIGNFDLNHPEKELINKFYFTDQIAERENLYTGKAFDKTSPYIPFNATELVETIDHEDTWEQDEKVTNYFVYDLENKQLINIPLFEDEKTLLLTDRNKIYVAKDLADQLVLYEMNLETEELKEIAKLDMYSPSIGRNQDISYTGDFNEAMTILDGKLYAYEHEYKNFSLLPIFQVIDIENQETVFLGKIDREDASLKNPIEISIMNYRLNPTEH